MTDTSITARSVNTRDIARVIADLWENYFASDTALMTVRNKQDFYNLGELNVFGSVPVATAPGNLGQALEDHAVARARLGAFYGLHGTRAFGALMRYLTARAKLEEFGQLSAIERLAETNDYNETATGATERQLRAALTELEEASAELAVITTQIKRAAIADVPAND
jgi:hypothetical protein